MAMEEQFIELIGEFELDKWYIIRPTRIVRPGAMDEMRRLFQREMPIGGTGGILILADYLDIEFVETYTVRSILKALRINIDILHALYRQIKWRPWVRLRGALQKLGKIV